MRLILSLFFTFSLCALFSQDYSLDQFYNSSSVINEFNTSSQVQLDSAFNQYLRKKGISGNQEELYEEFVYKHTYFLDRLNRSGQVFFDNEIVDYLNDLKDVILRDDSRKKAIRVLVTDFVDFNAFTNDFGTIYVNIATIAKMDSEEELMIILAHEISHVLLEHSYKLEYARNMRDTTNLASADELGELEIHSYSRRHELEADSLAYQMLSIIGVDLNKTRNLLDKLRHPSNTAQTGEIDLNILFLEELNSIQYFNELAAFADSSLNINDMLAVEHSDSTESTHPSIEERIAYYSNLDYKVDSVSYEFDSRFARVNELAKRALLRKLILSEKYVEALYLVGILRGTFVDEPFLIQSELQILLLLTQQKYSPNPFNNIVNDYGNSCDNIDYIKFRNRILRIPALEMNILTLNSCTQILNKNPEQDSTIERIQDLSLQFLYKNNPFMFKANAGKIVFNEDLEVNNYHTTDLSIFNSYYQKKEIKKLTEKNYMFAFDIFSSSQLQSSFTNSYPFMETLHENVIAYKKTRDNISNALTIEQLFMTIMVDETRIKKDDKFEYNTPILLTKIENYFMVANSKDPGDNSTREIKQSVQSAENCINAWHSFKNQRILMDNFFTKDSTISVSDNYMQQVHSTYLSDCLNFKEVNYSSVDEEVANYRASHNNIRFLATNINFLEETKEGSGIIKSFLIIIDAENKSLAFIGQTVKKGPLNYYSLRTNINTLLTHVW